MTTTAGREGHVDLEHEEAPTAASRTSTSLSPAPVVTIAPADDVAEVEADTMARAVVEAQRTRGAAVAGSPRSTRVQRSGRTSAQVEPAPQRVPRRSSPPDVIHRQVEKGTGWSAHWAVGPSQTEIDRRFRVLQKSWTELNRLVELGMTKHATLATDAGDELNTAKELRDRFAADADPRTVDWGAGKALLLEFRAAITSLGGTPPKEPAETSSASESSGGSRGKKGARGSKAKRSSGGGSAATSAPEFAEDTILGDLEREEERRVTSLNETVGESVVSGLLRKRTVAQIEVHARNIGAALLGTIGDRLGRQKWMDLFDDLDTDADRAALLPIGSALLRELLLYDDVDVAALRRFVHGASTTQIDAVVDAFTEEELAGLCTAFTCVRVHDALIGSLGADRTKKALGTLEASDLAEILVAFRFDDAGGHAAVRGLIDTKQARFPALHEHRVRVAAIADELPDRTKIGDHWGVLTTALFKKMINGADGDETGEASVRTQKANTNLGGLFDATGVASLRSFATAMTRQQLLAAKTRLGDAAYRGWASAVEGATFKSVLTLAADHDDYLKQLGTNHAARLKSAHASLGADATKLIVTRSAGKTAMTAARTAEFLGLSVTHKWKKTTELGAFFTKAGDAVDRILKVAVKFADDGNHGQFGEKAGGGGSATAVASKGKWTIAEGDIDHYMAGHSYARYAMTEENATRASSTMWDAGTDRATIEANAATVAAAAAFGAPTWNAQPAYFHRTVASFSIGVERDSGRVTQMYPTGGTQHSPGTMSAVVELINSRG